MRCLQCNKDHKNCRCTFCLCCGYLYDSCLCEPGVIEPAVVAEELEPCLFPSFQFLEGHT